LPTRLGFVEVRADVPFPLEAAIPHPVQLAAARPEIPTLFPHQQNLVAGGQSVQPMFRLPR